MAPERLFAFVDESGQRSFTQNSSDYFVLACIAIPESRLPDAADWLVGLRSDLGRQPLDTLHWNKFPAHTSRLRASQALGEQGFGRALAVVSCKRHLQREPSFTQDHAYMLAFRYLLERLSWLARQRRMELNYTLAHVRGFPKAKLREYEAKLRVSENQIDWSCVSSVPSKIERPETVEYLQIADIVASSIGVAFNPDKFGNVETRYVHEYKDRFYRGWEDTRDLTSYGLKMHPWTDNTKAAHPWVAAL